MNKKLEDTFFDIEYAAFDGFDLQDMEFFHTYTRRDRRNTLRAYRARKLIEDYWLDLSVKIDSEMPY